MIINGKEVILEKSLTLLEYIQSLGHKVEHVAVEKNGIIVPRANFATELLTNEDKIEIVCFVGGG